MANIDIRDYLYHGIVGRNYRGTETDPSLAIFESILKDGYLLLGDDLKERSIYSVGTCYCAETGWSPRISFGFYPLNEKIFEIVTQTSMFDDYLPKSLKNYIKKFYNLPDEELDNFVMNCPFIESDKDNFAWKRYYLGLTLVFDSKLLESIIPSSYAALYDEVCVEEKVSLRDYLIAVSIPIYKDEYEYQNDRKEIVKYEIEEYDKRYTEVLKLLKKYSYDIPVIEFKTGKEINEHGPVLVRVKK